MLTHRVAYLHQVHGISLNGIVVLTFTRASAKELRDRLRLTFGEKYGQVRVSTLHSFALRQLLRNDSAPGAPDRVAIADDLDESEVILPDLRIRLGLKKVKDVRDLLTALAAGLSQVKEDADPHWEESKDLAPLVTALREHRRAYGYGLRLELVYLLYKALATKPNFDLEPFSHVLVDEYQDLTECELRVVRHLTDRSGVLYAAGDDDQSIYGWREAKPEGIRRFETDFGSKSFLYLEECQRCDQEIIDFAMKVISQDLDRIGKSLHSVSSDRGEFDCCGYPGDVSEAQAIALRCKSWKDGGLTESSLLILARTSKEFPRILKQLELKRLSVAKSEDPYLGLRTDEARKVHLFLRLVQDERDHLAWREFLRKSGFGGDTVFEYHKAAVSWGRRFGDLLGAVLRDPGSYTQLPRAADVAGLIESTLSKLTEFRDSASGIAGSAEAKLVKDLELATTLALGHVDPNLVADLAKASKDVAAETGKDPSWTDAVSALAGWRNEIDQDAPTAPGIRIMTMHNAKGLDAPAVVIAGADHEVMHAFATTRDEELEEVRLLYMSVTRAKHKLAITFPGRRSGDQRHRTGGAGNHRLSDFLSNFVTPQIVRN